MLFGRQLLHSSNTSSTVVRNLTEKINRISNHFWDRWRHEYEVNLRETQRTSKLNINSPKINVNNIAIVTGILLPSRDSEIKGAIVRIAKSNAILKHPVNKVFSVENTYHDTGQTSKAREKN